MFEKLLIIFSLINYSVFSFSNDEKTYSFKAVYESIEPNQNMPLFKTSCKVLDIKIDEKSIKISSSDNDYYHFIKDIGNYTALIRLNLSECDSLSYMFEYANLKSIKFLDDLKIKT